jgi:hypothetical protein
MQPPAINSVLHDPAHPSSVLIPVVRAPNGSRTPAPDCAAQAGVACAPR